MSEQVEEDTETRSEEKLRSELYEQLDVSQIEKFGIEHIVQRLERNVDTEERYELDPRSKILSEIALIRAYRSEPKFGMFAYSGAVLICYDILHVLNPAFYGTVFVGVATLNGFISSLRSPSMMAVELEGETDEDGMPANYRAKAIESVNTNITMLLFGIAFTIQIITISSIVTDDLITRNLAAGTVNPFYTFAILVLLARLVYKIRN